MDFECDINLHVIKDQVCQVGLVEYTGKKSKFEIFLRRCESDVEDIVLKQKKPPKLWRFTLIFRMLIYYPKMAKHWSSLWLFSGESDCISKVF